MEPSLPSNSCKQAGSLEAPALVLLAWARVTSSQHSNIKLHLYPIAYTFWLVSFGTTKFYVELEQEVSGLKLTLLPIYLPNYQISILQSKAKS